MDAGHEDQWQNGSSSNTAILFSIHFNNPLRAFIILYNQQVLTILRRCKKCTT